MNILHLDDERWDSGLTHYALDIARLQMEAGHRVVLGVRRGSKPELRASELKIPSASFSGLISLATLIRGERWDVINAHTGRMHSWALLLRARGIPVIRTRGDAREPRATPFDRMVYSNTAAVICASRHIADMCRDHLPIPAQNLHVIYPGHASLPFLPPPLARVGILGRLDPVKGHANFLEAAALVLKKHPEARFLIAGAEANLTYSLLQNQIKVLGIGHAVEYLGRVASASQFMQSCTLGVIPSIGSEEISRACLEWMAAGRAVIGTLVGCLPELIEPGETGLITAPDDSGALAEAIGRCLDDQQRTRKWGEKGRERLDLHFSRREQLEQTMKIYAMAGAQ